MDAGRFERFDESTGEPDCEAVLDPGFAATTRPEFEQPQFHADIPFQIAEQHFPRFTLQPKEAYLGLTFAKLRQDLSDRLAHGALELALVGDFDEPTALALVARTLGALPAREPAFRAYTDNRTRAFTAWG